LGSYPKRGGAIKRSNIGQFLREKKGYRLKNSPEKRGKPKGTWKHKKITQGLPPIGPEGKENEKYGPKYQIWKMPKEDKRVKGIT